MAERRMMTKKVTDDDRFMNLSSSAQALYLHLNMSADDDGFCNQVSVAMFKAHASVQDLEALLAARYLLQFDSGVIVIKHWRMANALRKDRYNPTTFQEEFAKLELKKNGAYTERLPDGCRLDANCLPQVRLGKDRLDQDREGKKCVCVGARDNEPDDPDEDDGFDEFWEAYPSKSGDIRQAYFEYLGVIQSGVDPKILLDAVKWQREAKEPRYMGAAEKWLRNKGWTEKKTEPRQKKQKSYTSAADYVAPGDDATLEEIASVFDKI